MCECAWRRWQHERMSKDQIANLKGNISNISLRQTMAPQHQRPSLGSIYAPSPAPGSTINIVRKRILKAHEDDERKERALNASLLGTKPTTPGSRVGTAGSNKVSFIDSYKKGEGANHGLSQRGSSVDPATGKMASPRTTWRRQFWKKNTPWGVDRDLFGGAHHYNTTIKSSVRNYDQSARWERDPKFTPPPNSEDIIRQIVYKLEEHCNTTFALTRAFKIFGEFG